ncbi:MAG: long-chain fatty acid--CoA ligase [Thermodesulfobacteriota bacterium]
MPKNFKAWPKDWPRSLNYPEVPVYDLLNNTAARVPNRLALVFGGMELTFSELKLLADRFAAALDALGVQKGDRVAIHLVNCPQFAIAYYATLRIGAVFTPLSPMSSPREARYQLADAGAETLISLDLIYPGIKDVLPETPVRRVITTSIADCYNPVIQPLKILSKIEVPDTLDFPTLLKEHQPFDREVPLDVREDLAHLAYTGGTTGVSKGVMLTHFNVVANALQYGCWFSGVQLEEKDGRVDQVYPPGVRPEDRLTQRDKEVALVVVPWFHAMGTVVYLNTQVSSGNTMVLLPRFDPLEYLEMIPKYGVTALGGAPQLYIPLINHPSFAAYDLSKVKVAGSGAAPLPGAVLDRLLEAFSGVVCEGYGLTECTMGAAANPPDRAALRPGSVGLPIFDTEMKTIDVLTGRDLPPGVEGELCLKGPQVMKGYWNKPAATAEVLKDGWLLTGDIGREDEDGFFYITDRKKDLIIYKGYNVYPRELEEVLFEHPAVAQCAVVGQAHAEGGEIPVAFIQLKPEARATAEEMMEHVNRQVAPYKKVRRVIFLDQIPVSAAGKVLRKELRERLKQE